MPIVKVVRRFHIDQLMYFKDKASVEKWEQENIHPVEVTILNNQREEDGDFPIEEDLMEMIISGMEFTYSDKKMAERILSKLHMQYPLEEEERHFLQEWQEAHI